MESVTLDSPRTGFKPLLYSYKGGLRQVINLSKPKFASFCIV